LLLAWLLQVCTAPVHTSSVQPTLSSHSVAEQQLPQLAVVPSALGQHLLPPSHRGLVPHVPPLHTPTMHGSVVLHCESSQHSAAQPAAQHSDPCSQNSFLQKLSTQLSVVHGLASTHVTSGSSGPHGTLGWQLSLIEQNSAVAQAESSGKNMQWPAWQVLVVQATPSSQSTSSQHSLQSPSQHLAGAAHLGAVAQMPSMLHASSVQTSPSSQSSGLSQRAVPPPEPALPPVLLAPALLLPAVLPPLPSLPRKELPPHALNRASAPNAKNAVATTSLGLSPFIQALLITAKTGASA
jgi:hypothetical protein